MATIIDRLTCSAVEVAGGPYQEESETVRSGQVALTANIKMTA